MNQESYISNYHFQENTKESIDLEIFPFLYILGGVI